MKSEEFISNCMQASSWNAMRLEFENKGRRVAYYAKDKKVFWASSGLDGLSPVWKLVMARPTAKALQDLAVTTNYVANNQRMSESERGIMALTLKKRPTLGRIDTLGSAPDGTHVHEISLGDMVISELDRRYPVPSGKTHIVSDIQAIAASIKTDQGYAKAGTRTVHRLYLATAFILLRKKHASGTKDGVVALVVDKVGNIVSWGMKNPDVSCWHGETSAVMRLGGHVPEGGCVFSTLKPCKMCAGLIHDAGNGTVKAFYGQDDPVKDAQSTALDKSRMGAALDAHKGVGLPSGIVLESETPPTKDVLGKKLESGFTGQDGPTKAKNRIEFVTSDAVADLMRRTEAMLRRKSTKYADRDLNATDINPNTKRAIDYLTSFLDLQGGAPDSLAS